MTRRLHTPQRWESLRSRRRRSRPGGRCGGADQISDGQWYVKALQLDAAHKITKGAGVVVAVIDTGIDATHPDLAGSVVAGTDTSREAPSNGLTDSVGHGTAMAGLIVGHGKTRGVAPQATVVSIRAETGGSGSPTDIGAAINWAVKRDVDIISISLASNDRDIVLQQAVENALRNNIVVVAGAGNTDKNPRVGYPASYPGVVAVGGTISTATTAGPPSPDPRWYSPHRATKSAPRTPNISGGWAPGHHTPPHWPPGRRHWSAPVSRTCPPAR